MSGEELVTGHGTEDKEESVGIHELVGRHMALAALADNILTQLDDLQQKILSKAALYKQKRMSEPSAMHPNIPTHLYLQVCNEDSADPEEVLPTEDMLWSATRVYDSDVRYVREDLAKGRSRVAQKSEDGMKPWVFHVEFNNGSTARTKGSTSLGILNPT